MKQTIEKLHVTPGRVRIRLNGVQEDHGLIEAKMRMIPGVTSATYSEITRTAILYFAKSITVSEVIKTARVHFHKNEASKSAKKSWLRDPKLKDMKIVLISAIVEKMFITSAPLGVSALFRPTSIATLFASRKTIFNGIKSVLKPNEDTLTTSAMVASMLRGSPSSAFIIYVMSTISELLNEYTIEQTRGYVRGIMDVDVKHAWLISPNGSEVKVSVDQIQKGDHVMVFQGDMIPFDGEIINYEGEVDQSAITGEYLPVKVGPGSYVYAGTIVAEGKIAFQVDEIGEDLTVNRMIRMIEEAQVKQGNIQTSTQNFTKKVIPLSFIMAAGIYFVTKDWNRVLNMLVIDYVCGVNLSTATAISATIGQSAQTGALIKGGHILEKLADVNTLVLDKTGTITMGMPVVTQIYVSEGYTEEEVLAYSASVEEHSTHPIASAILNEAKKRGIIALIHQDETVENHVGKGVLAWIEGEIVLTGSADFLRSHGVEINENTEASILVAKGKELIGGIEIDDEVRPGIVELIKRLKENKVDECIMLTGDNEKEAASIAAQVGIDRYIANAMPEEKAEFVRALKEDENRVVMMVGDGINDAPALAYSDVGVTLGAKMTDIAMETADMVIHSENPLLIADSIDQSIKAKNVIRQNILVTLVINTGAIVFGTLGVIRPVVGAAVHNAATIGVVLNSTRLMLKGDDSDVS